MQAGLPGTLELEVKYGGTDRGLMATGCITHRRIHWMVNSDTEQYVHKVQKSLRSDLAVRNSDTFGKGQLTDTLRTM
ncbi:hypothetical protein WJX77_006573 [Trebouxia sp. C0004]